MALIINGIYVEARALCRGPDWDRLLDWSEVGSVVIDGADNDEEDEPETIAKIDRKRP
jgi:hypothetical protein